MSREARRRQIREENRERQRCKGLEIQKEKDGEREKLRALGGKKGGGGGVEKHSSLHSLLLQLCHLHSSDGGSASAEQPPLLTAGLEEGGGGAEGGGVVSVKPSVRTEWHFMPAKSIPSPFT